MLSKIADDQKFSRVKCQYSAETQLELVDKILKKRHGRYLEEMRRHSVHRDPTESQITGGSAMLCAMDLWDIAAFLKHPSFQEEKEHRLVRGPSFGGFDSRVHYRCTKTMLIPYSTIDLSECGENLGISEIIIGPTPEPKLAINSMRSYLRKAGIYAQVTSTTIPYREWQRTHGCWILWRETAEEKTVIGHHHSLTIVQRNETDAEVKSKPADWLSVSLSDMMRPRAARLCD